MHFVTNLFPVMGLQNLSKSVKICQSYWEKFAATFFMPHSVYCSCRYDRQKMRKWDKHLRNKLRHYSTSASARCIPAICQAYTSCVINPVQRSIKLFYFVYKIGSETDFWEGYFFYIWSTICRPLGYCTQKLQIFDHRAKFRANQSLKWQEILNQTNKK